MGERCKPREKRCSVRLSEGAVRRPTAHSTEEGRAEESTKMRKKILAVDDERHIVRLIEVNLLRQGYDVVTAFDGKEALEKVETEHPDLVILDVMMPYMDGFEALKCLKKDPATRDIPVIMLTAKAMDSDIYHGWQSGVHCYLTKPFSPPELLSFVRRIFAGESVDDGEGRYNL